MSGFDNDVVYSNNADFSRRGSGGGSEVNGLQTDGELWIGTTSTNIGGTHIDVGVLTSPGSTVSIGYSSPNITLDVSGSFSETFNGNSGSATPSSGVLNILGTGSITTVASGNTVTISSTGSFPTTLISANQTLLVNNDYFCVSPGGALSLALPSTSSVGDEIEVSLDGATSFSITQSAGQSIRMGNLITTTGVGGSLTSTQQGDTVRMKCKTANLAWNVLSSMGNPIIV